MLNASASLAAKKAGIQLALDMSGDWPAQVLPELESWLVARRAAGHEAFTLEQFRAAATHVPASHKAWGSLPRLACAAGLIEPAVRGDGSPVMQPAESVRTHGHFVRVWRIVGARASTSQHAASAEPVDSQNALSRVGEGAQARFLQEKRVQHPQTPLDACSAYHAGRADMDQAMGEGGA